MARSFELTTPVLIGLVCLVGGMIAFFSFSVLDKKLDTQMEEIKDESSDDEKFSFKDVATILSNPGFWLIALLCVLFYSCVFPFQKFASELMITKYGIDENVAGFFAGLPALGALILTPVFGGMVDKHVRSRNADIRTFHLCIAFRYRFIRSHYPYDSVGYSILARAFCHVAFGSEDIPCPSAWNSIRSHLLHSEHRSLGNTNTDRFRARQLLYYRQD